MKKCYCCFCSPISSKKFRQRCQNCILRVHRDRWCECIFFKICFLFPAFRSFSKNIFRTFVKKTPNALSELRSMCPKKKFWRKVFPNLAFFVVLGPCVSFYWLSGRFLSPGSSKPNFTCPGERHKGSLIWWKCVIFFLFSDFEQKISTTLSELYSSCPQGPLVWMYFFQNLFSIPCLSEFQQKYFSDFC